MKFYEIIIPLVSKSEIKFIRSLKQKKYRYIHRQFVVEGNKIALESLHYCPDRILKIFALDSWFSTNQDALKGINEKLILVSTKEMERISFLSTPQEVLCLLEMGTEEKKDMATGGWSIYLDRIQDPGNLGAMYRVAEWFGISNMILSPDTVDIYNPKVIQASMGSMLRVTTFEADILWLNDQEPVFRAAMDGGDIYQKDFPANGILVLGNEGQGVHPSISGTNISIPRYQDTAYPESLNVSVAGGILIAEIMRKR